jgi:hypothetical protein
MQNWLHQSQGTEEILPAASSVSWSTQTRQHLLAQLGTPRLSPSSMQ